jgi:hypothetical protein
MAAQLHWGERVSSARSSSASDAPCWWAMASSTRPRAHPPTVKLGAPHALLSEPPGVAGVRYLVLRRRMGSGPERSRILRALTEILGP